MNPQDVENLKYWRNAKFWLTTSDKNVIYAYVRHPHVRQRRDQTLKISDRGWRQWARGNLRGCSIPGHRRNDSVVSSTSGKKSCRWCASVWRLRSTPRGLRRSSRCRVLWGCCALRCPTNSCGTGSWNITTSSSAIPCKSSPAYRIRSFSWCKNLPRQPPPPSRLCQP